MNDTTTKEDGKLAQALEWLNAPREELPQEYHDAFAVWCEVDAIDMQAKELETTQPVGVTEILARRAALKELHTERARLLAVLDGQEQLEQEPSPAPSPDEPAPTILKKKALIAQLKHEWPSIEADLKDATRNGLKDAAATGVHGEWFVEPAHAWAQRKGKLKQAAPAHTLANVWRART